MLLLCLATLARATDVTWYRDADGDGAGDPYRRTVAPSGAPPEGYAARGDDCDDDASEVNPAATETCDGVDEDCDGNVDSAALCGFPMNQRAGHGYLFLRDPQPWEDAQAACASLGYHMVTVTSEDEDLWLDGAADAVSTTKWWLGFNDRLEEGQWVWEDATGGFYTNWYTGEPNDGLGGGTEDCALINRFHPDRGWNDEPCGQSFRGICESGPLLDLYPDADGDGFGAPATYIVHASDILEGYADNPDDCDDTDPTVNPAATETWYDGRDADCDGWDDADADHDGERAAAAGGTDCDDADSTTRPGAVDPAYDGVDADCDGTDDPDGDGWADPAHGGTDCDDANPAVHPGAVDAAGDGVDSDCDGADGAPDSGDTGTTPDDTGTAASDDTAGPDDEASSEAKDTGCAGCASTRGNATLMLLLAAVASTVRRRRPTPGDRRE